MQYFIVDEYTTEDNKGMSGSESTESLSSASSPHHQETSQTIEKDLIMVKNSNLLLSSCHNKVMLNINLVFPPALGSHASPCLCL
jgi:hypothetical protein